MEVLAVIGGIFVLYVLWLIINGMLISKVVTTLIGILNFIGNRDLTPEEIVNFLKAENLKYHTSDEGYITWSTPVLKEWWFTYYPDLKMATADCTMRSQFAAVSLIMEKSNNSIIRYEIKDGFPLTKNTVILLAKLNFYGVREKGFYDI